jgi:hypothetical protein
VLLIGVPLLMRHSLLDAFTSWLKCTEQVLRRLVQWL